MRLIDADKLILHLNDYALGEAPDGRESAGERRISKVAYNAIQDCIEAVDEQPTAYNPNAVVKELRNYVIEFEVFGICSEYVELSHAIEIVKRGQIG